MGADAAWNRPASHPMLRRGEVHVWRVPLDLPAPFLPPEASVLTDQEQSRAREYFFPRDRDRYKLLRVALRMILGRYMDLDPRNILLTYGPRGKPMVAGEGSVPPPRFNVSHSHDLGLIAVARDYPVGIDLEAVRADIDCLAIAKRFFSAGEYSSLIGTPASARGDAFVTLWTRKEACLKAVGSGLAGGLEEIEVSPDLHRTPVLLHAPVEMLPVSRWELFDLAPAEGYRGCVVVECQDALLKQWVWPGWPLDSRIDHAAETLSSQSRPISLRDGGKAEGKGSLSPSLSAGR